MEGWLKGEMLLVLDGLVQGGHIAGLDREVKVGPGQRKRIDLRVDVQGMSHWLELKHWLVGRQRGTTYGPSFYFGDPTSVGIRPDAEKLMAHCPAAGGGFSSSRRGTPVPLSGSLALRSSTPSSTPRTLPLAATRRTSPPRTFWACWRFREPGRSRGPA